MWKTWTYPQDLWWPIVQSVYRKPDQEALILFYEWDVVAWWIHSTFGVPKVWDLLHISNISDYRIREQYWIQCLSTAEHDRNILKHTEEHTRAGTLKTQQLCDAEVIRHQHFCSILGPALSCSYPLWLGPALLGIYFLILPQLFTSTHIRFGKYQIYFERTPWREAQELCAGCRTWHSHIYPDHPEVLQPHVHCRWGVAEHWYEEQGEIKRYWAAVLPSCIPPLLTVMLLYWHSCMHDHRVI